MDEAAARREAYVAHVAELAELERKHAPAKALVRNLAARKKRGGVCAKRCTT
jgi:hypothetical protein